jgi:hypothetical protein
MPRPRIPVRRLKRFAEEHVLYEAGMLNGLTVKLLNRHHQDDPVVENGLLESFTVHARLVRDFLYVDEPQYPTDAAAADYFDDDTWQETRPAMSERVAGINERVGKEIVHLSYRRLDVDDEEKGWLILGLGPEIIGNLTVWAHLVPTSRLPEGWLERFDLAAGAISEADLARAVEVPTHLPDPSDSR